MRDRDESPPPGLRVGGWGPTPSPAVCATLLLVSMGVLTLELSLTRLFSFTVWYHFAYLTISVALLGFGASGAWVASFPDGFRHHGVRRVARWLVWAAALTVMALVILARFPLEIPLLMAHPGLFALALLAYYVAVGAPFLLAGFAVSLPFAAYPRHMGRLYFWDLLGAALGCALTVRLIEPFGVPGLILAAAGLLLLGASALFASGRQRTAGVLAGAAGAVVLALSPWMGGGMDVALTSTKSLAELKAGLRADDAFSKWTALNRVDAFGWRSASRVTFWGGIGVSSDFGGRRPRAARLFYDGGNGSDIYRFDGSFDDFEILDHHILRTPYVVRDRPDVLVIGVGGGIDVINALRHGARHVTGVELQPETVALLRDRLPYFTGGLYRRPDVTLVVGEGRHFVRKTERVFDLLQITAVDTFAAQATGAYVLAESYLYTVEAQEDFLARLGDDGLLSMVVGDICYPDMLPPLATRLALNGRRALERRGVAHPELHIAIIAAREHTRNAETAEVLVKKRPFTAAESGALARFAQENGFEVLYLPDGSSHPLGAVLVGDEKMRQAAIDASWFRVDPVYDGDPFFYNVGKWANFTPRNSVLFIFPGSFIGQLVLVLMLAQSLVLGAGLIVFPLTRATGQGVRVADAFAYLAYFLALGVGFMFIEISFVQSFVLFLGSPTYALSVTISALLVFSAAGSLASSRFADRSAWALRRLSVVVAALVLVYAAGLSRVFAAFLHLDLGWRILIAVVAQLPIGLALGMFMPLGIARVSRVHPRLVPWAWGINGLGSVAGSTLAVILAMSWGFAVVACCAAALYVVGTALMLRHEPHGHASAERGPGEVAA